jgi:UDP-2,3-diacylglucosamine pyrophosphatase LpxH
MRKRVFVSDVHMSPGWSLGSPKGRYDWFDRDEAAHFADFLAHLDTDDSIQEVILLGDILDDWVYPIDVRPPHYEQIVSAAHVVPIMDNLKALSDKKHVVYVQGNHDLTITDDQLSRFRSTFFPRISFRDSFETADGIYAEHGHRHVMYDAADPDPGNTLPLGHYISRLAATIEARKAKRCRQSEVTETLFPSTSVNVNNRGLKRDPFVNVPLTYLANELGDVNDATPIVTVSGNTITLGRVREMYKNLSRDWAEDHGALDPLHSIWMEAEGFWGLVQQMAVDMNKKVIILGHTHKKENCYLGTPDAITGEISEPYAIYANCGSWCNHNDPHPKPYTYVVTEYDEATDRHTVSLMYWRETREPEVKVIGGLRREVSEPVH